MGYMRDSDGRRLDAFAVRERDAVQRLVPVKNLLPAPTRSVVGGWRSTGSGTGGTSTTEMVPGGGYQGRVGFRQVWTVAPTGGSVGISTTATDSTLRAAVSPASAVIGGIWVLQDCASLLQAQSRVIFFNAAGASIDTQASVVMQVPTGKWRRVQPYAGFQPPAAAVSAIVEVWIPTASQIGIGSIMISCPQVEQEGCLSTYRDGSFTDARWSGSTGLSTTYAALGITNRIAIFGDSHVGQASGSGFALEYHLTEVLDRDVYWGGRGGETITGIGIRQGGVHAFATFEGNTIAASGTTNVTGVTFDPGGHIRTTGTWQYWGYFLGADGTTRVYGTLQLSSDVWTFSRTQSGSAVPVAAGSRFYATTEQRAADIVLLQGGNNVETISGERRPTLDQAIATFNAMAERCRELGQDYLVLDAYNNADEPEGSAGYEYIHALNEANTKNHPGRRTNDLAWLIQNGLTATWLTPTGDDATAISQDRIPPTLMADSVHLNNTTRRVIAAYLRQQIVRRGALHALVT